jgi:hypothetical protein
MYYTNEYKAFNWPYIEFLYLEHTHKWFQKLNLGLKQLASNNIEYSLFSLLNASDGKDSPPNILWLTQCIEAIYQSPIESILTTIKRRIYLNLGQPSHKKVNKRINE